MQYQGLEGGKFRHDGRIHLIVSVQCHFDNAIVRAVSRKDGKLKYQDFALDDVLEKLVVDEEVMIAS